MKDREEEEGVNESAGSTDVDYVHPLERKRETLLSVSDTRKRD